MTQHPIAQQAAERVTVYAVRRPGMSAWSYHLTKAEALDERDWLNRGQAGSLSNWYLVHAEEVDADDPVVLRLQAEAREARQA